MKTRSGVEPDIERLYQLPLDEFVQARNELATRLRGEGETEEALRVQSLAKPALSAWAVNQLYWHGRQQFDALMGAGQKLRAAQEASLKGRAADIRDAGKERDAALIAALDRTLAVLQEAGHPAAPAMRLRIATNLEALAAWGGAPPGVAPGRLAEDLDPPGFEIFQGMQGHGAPAARTTPARPRRRAAAEVVSFEAIANARRAVADAERLVAEKRTEAHRAADALERARAEVKAAQAEAEKARAAWEEAQRYAEQAQRRVPEREDEVERARRAAEEAGEALRRARTDLDAVKKSRTGY